MTAVGGGEGGSPKKSPLTTAFNPPPLLTLIMTWPVRFQTK
jgi:hypothetical protein